MGGPGSGTNPNNPPPPPPHPQCSCRRNGDLLRNVTFDIGTEQRHFGGRRDGKRIKVNGYAIKSCGIDCKCGECNPNQYKRGYWRVFKKTKDIIKKKYKYNKLNESQVEKLKHITELLRDL